MTMELDFVTCTCSACGHEARVMRSQWAESFDTEITAATAGKLFDKLPCTKCRKKAANIKHPDGKRDIILISTIKRCKGEACNHAPLSLIYLEKKPEPDTCLDCIEAKTQEAMAKPAAKLPTIPPEYKQCPKCERPTVVNVFNKDDEPYIECSRYKPYGNVDKSACHWYSSFPPDTDDTQGHAILARLKTWRKTLPNSQMRYLPDRLLLAFSRYKPITENQLKEVRGIGEGNGFLLSKYGKNIIVLIKK